MDPRSEKTTRYEFELPSFVTFVWTKEHFRTYAAGILFQHAWTQVPFVVEELYSEWRAVA